MSHALRPHRLLALCCTLAAAAASAGDDVDVSRLYEVTTEGSSTRVTAGEKGKLVLSIKSKDGSHISDEAPLKIQVGGKGVTPEKSSLAYKDQVSKKADGQKYADPVVFEVPFTADPPPAPDAKGTGAPASATLDAKLTFYVCTDQLCARQQKTVSVPVQVCATASRC
jgi:hypothetical protein